MEKLVYVVWRESGLSPETFRETVCGPVAQCGASRAHAGYEVLLEDPEVDCVYLAMPAGLRAPWLGLAP